MNKLIPFSLILVLSICIASCKKNPAAQFYGTYAGAILNNADFNNPLSGRDSILDTIIITADTSNTTLKIFEKGSNVTLTGNLQNVDNTIVINIPDQPVTTANFSGVVNGNATSIGNGRLMLNLSDTSGYDAFNFLGAKL